MIERLKRRPAARAIDTGLAKVDHGDRAAMARRAMLARCDEVLHSGRGVDRLAR